VIERRTGIAGRQHPAIGAKEGGFPMAALFCSGGAERKINLLIEYNKFNI